MLLTAERSGERKGRFFGVTKTVMVKAAPPRRARRWVKSRRGIMWPCAGNGKIKTWVFVGLLFSSFPVIMSFSSGVFFVFAGMFWWSREKSDLNRCVNC